MPVKIDGSFGEGGGQILRTAIALSCITGIPVEVYNIRANRPRPGLSMQHLKGIEAAKLLSNAEVKGLKIGSTKIFFAPKEIRGGDYRIDIKTAGSISLVLQVLIPVGMAAESPVTLTVTGGTDVRWSPPVDYLKNVTLRGVREMGGKADLRLVQRGYYPEGGGIVSVRVEPSKLKGRIFEAKKVREIRGVSHCSNLPEHVAKRQAASAKNRLEELQEVSVNIDVEVWKSVSTGSGITLWCDSILAGGSSLGEKGKRAEVVGREAADQIIYSVKSGAALDEWAGDQMMVFAALAGGKTAYTVSKVTRHQISNAYVINSFFDGCVNVDEENRKIEVRGLDLL